MTVSEDRRDAFVREYLVDLNASGAYVRAGYSPISADTNSSRLMQDPAIQDAIASAMKARSERTHIKADEVLELLAEACRVDVADMFEEDGSLVPFKRMPKAARRTISGFKVKETYDMDAEGKKVNDGRIIEVKLKDGMQALAMAMKHLGIAGADVTKHDVTDELADRLAKAQRGLAEKEPDHG